MTDLTATLREGLAGRYRIEREIGRGGMATVFLARDTRHDRNVAVKVLDSDLGAVLGAERFLAEIKVTANLQHPNLLPLFDSGAVDGLLYYVMPFIEGESLRHRLDREKQLPVSEAVQIAVGIAKALAFAHARGVIHRDLKPENVLLQAGQPLVADFGIALAVSNAGGTRVTQTGLSLGTPQYMSPEQATGDRTVDGRSDIYALGAVLYEMLTGEPPHTGVTVQAVIARVLTDKPRSVRLSRPGVPVHVEAAIERALEKIPADRFPSADRFAEALEGKGESIGPTTSVHREASPARSWQRVMLLALPWMLLAGVSALLVARSGSVNEPSPVTRTVIAHDGLNSPQGLTITPDGRHIVFTALRDGERQLFVRALDDLLPRALPGTVNAEAPFISPDSRWIGFFIENRLKRIPLTGGVVEDLGDTYRTSFRGASWTDRNEIIIGGGRALRRVASSGGIQDSIVDDSGRSVRGIWPLAAPGGEYVFYQKGGPAGMEDDFLAVASLRTGRHQVTEIPSRDPVAVLLDHVLFRRDDGALMAVKWDAGAGRIMGDPIQVLEPARAFAVSKSGTAVYYTDSGIKNLVLRAGDSTRALWTAPAASHTPRLSPDGRSVALGRQGEVWVYDLATGTPSRLAEVGQAPEWSADGRRVLYTYQPLPGMHPTREVRWRVRDGSAPEETLFRSDSLNIRTAVQALDGRTLYISSGVTQGGIWRAGPGEKPVRIVDDGTQPRVSPDGKWLAYSSSESGASEVYVRPTSGYAAKLVVSVGGGFQPMWDRNGRSIVYQGRTGLMRATIETTPSLRVMRRDLVLTGGIVEATSAQFDVATDGQRLLVLERRSGGERIILVQNFIEELRARLAAASPRAR
jgi:serine/threonine-protein kinase